MVGVSYIVNDVDAAIDFYCGQLGFHENMHPAHRRHRGVGRKQIVLEDPSGNPVELFEPTRPEASLSGSPGGR